MKRKNSNILKKTIKISSFTCISLGGAALIASGAGLKALTEGAKYLKNTVQEIIRDGSEDKATHEGGKEIVENTVDTEESGEPV